MSYLNKIQWKLMLVIVSLVLAPQLFAQSVKSIYTKVGTLNSQNIQTDKRNYNTGEIVDIAGVDFLSYERVRLNVKYFDTNLRQELPLSTWDVYADVKGRIVGEWQVHDVGGSGSRFIIEARGTILGATSKTEILTSPEAGEKVDIEQCANSNASPQNLDCPPSGSTGWVTGNIVASKARHFEGDSIAYRNILTLLTVGHSYKWTIKYDTSKTPVNAIDYLTTYNRTISNANPCANGANPTGYCTLASVTSTLAIPGDPKVANGRNQVPGGGDDITQIPGVITGWGANITAITVPVYTGTFPTGDSTASVDITFTATATTAILAWGGHISTRTDWGQAFGSVNIGGSPYHTENGGLMNLTDSTSCCTGTQALALQAAAVTPSARIVIVKRADPASTFNFGFTTTNLTPSTFSLMDTDPSPTINPSQVFDPINTFNIKRITENASPPYTLSSISCVVNVPGSPATPAPVVNLAGRFVDIDIKSGGTVTCTFVNDITTAAAVSVSGRVLDPAGNGLPRAYVGVTDGSGNHYGAVTNQFGNYTIDNLEAGDGYVFSVWNRTYSFQTQLVNVNESLANLNFYPQ